MPVVSGDIKLVTDNPAAVSQVWLRAPATRLHGESLVVDHPDTKPVVDGQLSFDALPGLLVMTLLSGGMPTGTVKMIVPDKGAASLRECVEAAGLADAATKSKLEELASEVADAINTVRTQVPGLVAMALAEDATVADAAALAVYDAQASRSPRVLVYYGTGTPSLADFPDARPGDVIHRLSDNSKWRVDE